MSRLHYFYGLILNRDGIPPFDQPNANAVKTRDHSLAGIRLFQRYRFQLTRFAVNSNEVPPTETGTGTSI